MAALEHPNIVRVLRYFETNGTAYYLMPYYKGQPLHHLLESEGVASAARNQRHLMLAPDGCVRSIIHEAGCYSPGYQASQYLHDRKLQ